MRKALLLLLVVLGTSCVSKNLTGTYPAPQQHYVESKDSFEIVWSKCMDYFAMNGIAVFAANKSDGKIISSKISFVNNYTREVNGRPLNSGAYVVIPTIRNGFGNILKPSVTRAGSLTMNGDCNVRIRENNGKMIVDVNLSNLDCSYYTGYRVAKIPIRSTGVFEQELLEYLSR